MGRPQKAGLDFFHLDVDIFDDDKIEHIGARFEEKGELTVVKLLQKIYRHNGYYMIWNDDEAPLFAKKVGKNTTPELVKNVVSELLKREFFHPPMFKRFSILTSYNIQVRYEKICKDAKRKGPFIKSEHRIIPYTIIQGAGTALPELMRFPPEETSNIREETAKTPVESTQSRVEKSRVEKSKEETTTPMSPTVRDVDVWKKEILNDQWLMETACMKARIGPNDYPEMVEYFFKTKISTKESNDWQSEKDCRRHFTFWCPRYLQIKNIDQGGKNGNPVSHSQQPAVKVEEPKDPLELELKNKKARESMLGMIESDVLRFTHDQNIKLMLPAIKLEILVEEGVIEHTEQQKKEFMQQARNDRVSQLRVSNSYADQALIKDYDKNKPPKGEQNLLVTMAKELAYRDYLRKRVSNEIIANEKTGSDQPPADTRGDRTSNKTEFT